ncbi:angiopoietin-2-like [Atheta coriaria]|uniref:angiopoietin-2-like n=1 Tax=Dalotia coriaria TaxID=877792 RepID=UPI0031F4067D
MWILSIVILIITCVSNIYCASYRGSNQLEAKLDEIQADLRDIPSVLLITGKNNEIHQLVQNTDAILKTIHDQFVELQKRTEIWSTHEHFITSWLDQISAVDRKLDIIIKGQDRLNKVETKLNLLHEQVNKIDIDKFENLMNTADHLLKTNDRQKKSPNNELFSFIDEYTTRGVLSTLNRIEGILLQKSKQQLPEDCGQVNRTSEILEDIASKVDIIVDKLTVPEPTVEQPVVFDPKPETTTSTTDSVLKVSRCSLNQMQDRSVTILDRHPIKYNATHLIEEYLNKSFVEYEQGFDTDTANWWGLINMKDASAECDLRLRVELWDFEDNFAWAEYDTFKIADDGLYTLTVDGYNGNATDSLSSLSGSPFSTYDNNNDQAPECCPCAITYGSGWWFTKCFEANLNGRYTYEDIDYYNGIIWEGWLGNYSLKRAKMIITSK